MKRQNLGRAVLTASLIAAGVQAPCLIGSAAAQAQAPRSLPMFEVDAAWPKVPAKWKLGDASSFAVDAQDNVWLLHRPRTLKDPDFAMAAPPVMVFDQAGNNIKAWGGDGPGYEWPQREHGIHIDYKGFVWIGGNSCPTNGLPRLKPVADDQLLKFNQDGKFVMQIGHSNQSKGNADTQNLHRPADEWVNQQSNELYVADGYGNRRVIVFDHDTGAFKRMWGAFGNKPEDDGQCEASASAASALRKPDFTPPGPQQFSLVHSVRVANDGMVYVADRENRRVQSFTVVGVFVKQLVKGDTPFARSVALSGDPEQKFLYVGNGDSIAIVERKSLELIGQIKPSGAIGGGHLIGTDPTGNIYVAATTGGMHKLTYKGTTTPAVR